MSAKLILFLLLLHRVPSNGVRLSIMEEQDYPNLTNIGQYLGDEWKENEVYRTLQYSLKKGFPYEFDIEPTELFKVGNSSGILSTAKAIDREKLCPNLVKCIVNLDVHITPLQRFTKVSLEIQIDDQNDNAPTFARNPIRKSVPEDSKSRIKLDLAIDEDSPDFGVQKYSVVNLPSSYKFVQENVNEIYLEIVQDLDREKQNSYSFKLRAEDTQGNIGETEVKIEVTDVNDNSPTCTQAEFKTSILENSRTGTRVLTISATDKDEGNNGKISYSFAAHSNNQQYFTIDKSSGDIRIGSEELDYESLHPKQILLDVIVTDEGNVKYEGHCKAIIDVLDINDNEPAVNVNLLNGRNVRIRENSETDRNIVLLLISDKDSGENGKFKCEVASNADQFYLETVGENEAMYLKNSVSFDREIRPKEEVVVICRDKAEENRLSSTTVIEVQIDDVNDQEPTFENDIYVAKITENNRPDTYVTVLKANDKDSGENGRIHYEIIEEEVGYENYFYIQINNGFADIWASRRLNYEEKREFELLILAVDHGEPRLNSTTKLKIIVSDEPDPHPVFPTVYEFNVTEGRMKGDYAGRVKAMDSENDERARLEGEPFEYSFNYNRYFTIDSSTGEIETNIELDREQFDKHVLTVTATSKYGNYDSATVDVIINVRDANDNKPNFIFPTLNNYTLFVSRNQEIETFFGTILAEDKDKDENGRLQYHITSGDSENYFRIDERSGKIKLIRSLKDASNNIEFKLEIFVRDNGTPPLHATEILVIRLNTTSSQSSGSSSVFEDENVIIIIAVCAGISLVFIVIIVTMLIIRKRQSREKKGRLYNCRTEEARTQPKSELDVLEEVPNTTVQVVDFQKRPPLKKEVTFELDNSSVVSNWDGDVKPPRYVCKNGPILPKTSTPVTSPNNLWYGREHDSHSDQSDLSNNSNTDSGKGPSEEGFPSLVRLSDAKANLLKNPKKSSLKPPGKFEQISNRYGSNSPLQFDDGLLSNRQPQQGKLTTRFAPLKGENQSKWKRGSMSSDQWDGESTATSGSYDIDQHSVHLHHHDDDIIV
ncbi:DgyrCDS8809 [Dimorphilus gyrociliatus]|uniref:DgyrCDS8809 n=1 Tax=Dimorphilus gyrociliatus TaxID=2664684 RepID=A0A7I8VXH0_9ANNE|nr:DgyrCDS8809 [Dimorphilus gyrociliatus]